jgi:hypothetical protein
MLKKITISVSLSLILTMAVNFAGNAQSATGFASPNTITDADAYNYANQYKTVKGGTVSGGVITKDALIQILNNTNCNAITYKFGMDPSGKIAPADAVFIILSGANVTEKDGQKTVTDIGESKYTPNNWCPPSCMKFMIKNAAGELVPVE